MEEEGKSKVRQELLELGFDEKLVNIAINISQDKEKAAEIVLKLSDEGPDADLSIYSKEKYHAEEKIFQQYIPKYGKTKMLFIVNGELKMGKGKVCAQVGHAVIGGYLQLEEEAKYQKKAMNILEVWEAAGTPKIVVKADTQAEMMAIMKKLEALKVNVYLVEDAGHTQIKAGSKTVLGVGPAFADQIDPVTNHLKLL